MNDISFIVDTLNLPPFEKKLTIVEFANKNPIELLQIVNDVFALIDETQRRDIRNESRSPEVMQQRMLQFIIVLNYKHNMELEQFRQAFFSGKNEVIYPLLQYVLQKFPELKKRAYIAPFLRSVDPPEEFFADASVVSSYETYKKYQDEFKQVHKQVDILRPTHNNPADLQDGIETLVKEREQLQIKLGKLRERVKGKEYASLDFEAILQATHKLQRETEEDHKLYMRLQEQKQKLARAHQMKIATTERLRTSQAEDLANQDPRVLLEKKRQEVQANRGRLQEILEEHFIEKRNELHDLERQLSSEPMSADEVRMLEQDIEEIQDSVEALTAHRDSQLANSDGKIRFMRQRVIDLESKQTEVEEILKEAEEERKEAEEEYNRLNQEFNKLIGNGERPKTDAEIEEFKRELFAKANRCKKLKAELLSGQQELQLLNRTVEILKSRDENLSELQEEIERAQGVEGFGSAQDELEQLSKQNDASNQAKGQTLTELSSIVAQINQTLQAKSKKLAPQIAELQQVRAQHAEVERVYKIKKSEYDNTVLGLESDRLHLDNAVQDNLNGIRAEESNYHFLSALSDTTDVKIQQMNEEIKFLADPGTLHVDGKFASYKDQLEAAIRDRETANRALRSEKKNIGETHEENVIQRRMFGNLKKLLVCKKTLAVEAGLKNTLMPGEGFASPESFDATANGERLSFDY